MKRSMLPKQISYLGLGTCGFITSRTDLSINGFTGSGKTHLACAIGKESCRHLHRTRYFRMPEMLEMLNLAMETGHSITSTVTKLSNYHLLIIDEWLLDIPTEQDAYSEETAQPFQRNGMLFRFKRHKAC